MSRPMGAASSALPCTIHRAHAPEPTYTEIHHVMPQAWQAFWQPLKPWPDSGPSPDRTMGSPPKPFVLFDARTIPLCRTGHGNVHYWLVAIMRQLESYAASSGTSADDAEAYRMALHRVRHDARAAHRTMVRSEVETAELAISRWKDAGGSLTQLIANRLWGEI